MQIALPVQHFHHIIPECLAGNSLRKGHHFAQKIDTHSLHNMGDDLSKLECNYSHALLCPLRRKYKPALPLFQ